MGLHYTVSFLGGFHFTFFPITGNKNDEFCTIISTKNSISCECILVARENAKFFVFFAKFRFYLFREKMRNFCDIRNAKILKKIRKRTYYNYDIIKLLMLSSQSREFHKFFCAISCCSYILIIWTPWTPRL